MPEISPISPPFGFQLAQAEQRLINRTGGTVAKGAIVMCDFAKSATECSSNTVGLANSGFYNVVTATVVGGGSVGVYAVAKAAVADNATGNFVLKGHVSALMPLSTIANETLTVSTGGIMLQTSGRQFALCLSTTSAAGQLAPVLFDGFGGFGGWGT